MKPVSRRVFVVCGVLMIVVSSAATARDPGTGFATLLPTIDAIAPGVVQVSSEGLLEERLAIPHTVPEKLIQVAPGGSVRIVAWPVSPGDHRTVRVTRAPVYARDARILSISDEGVREVPRSDRRHFVGGIEDEPGSGVLIILDPASNRVSGLSVSGGLTFDLEPLKGESSSDVRVVATHEKMSAVDPHWVCGGQEPSEQFAPVNETSPSKDGVAMKSGGPLEAVLAIDTDTELLSQKFGGSTAAAADYIADLIAAMNVMYASDLNVTLVQGTTILRTSSDPYSANSGGAASPTELYEFRNYWYSNYGSVQRTIAAMLSGKSPYSSSASGIAFIGGLCSKSSGYSFSKVFKINYLSGDARLVGHEIGHNFGSPHTHCYSPPIDFCWPECGVQTTSCPGGPGTVMSYCHLAGCGNNLLAFHSRVVDNILSNFVGPATGVCIFQAAAAGTLFSDDFESGGTGAWSGASP